FPFTTLFRSVYLDLSGSCFKKGFKRQNVQSKGNYTVLRNGYLFCDAGKYFTSSSYILTFWVQYYAIFIFRGFFIYRRGFLCLVLASYCSYIRRVSLAFIWNG